MSLSSVLCLLDECLHTGHTRRSLNGKLRRLVQFRAGYPALLGLFDLRLVDGERSAQHVILAVSSRCQFWWRVWTIALAFPDSGASSAPLNSLPTDPGKAVMMPAGLACGCLQPTVPVVSASSSTVRLVDKGEGLFGNGAGQGITAEGGAMSSFTKGLGHLLAGQHGADREIRRPTPLALVRISGVYWRYAGKKSLPVRPMLRAVEFYRCRAALTYCLAERSALPDLF